jgi:tripartite motif-containing protein 71
MLVLISGIAVLVVAICIGAAAYFASREPTARERPPQFLSSWGAHGSADGQVSRTIGFTLDANGNPVALPDDELQYAPVGVAVDPRGNVYVLDGGNSRIEKFTSQGKLVTTWGALGHANGEFMVPWGGVAVDPAGNVYVADTGNNRIQKFTSEGRFLTKWGTKGVRGGQFASPGGVAVDSDGNVYVLDSGNCRIQKFTSAGKLLTKWGSFGRGDGEFVVPWAIAVDRNGNVYVADNSNYRIEKFTSGGRFLTTWGRKGVGNGRFGDAEGVAVDQDANVYVVDLDNACVQKFTSDGKFLVKWGREEWFADGPYDFGWPCAVAVDRAGNICVADKGRGRVLKFGPVPSGSNGRSKH